MVARMSNNGFFTFTKISDNKLKIFLSESEEWLYIIKASRGVGNILKIFYEFKSPNVQALLIY